MVKPIKRSYVICYWYRLKEMHIDAIVSIRAEEIRFKVWYVTCYILHIVQFKNTNARKTLCYWNSILWCYNYRPFDVKFCTRKTTHLLIYSFILTAYYHCVFYCKMRKKYSVRDKYLSRIYSWNSQIIIMKTMKQHCIIHVSNWHM